MSQRSILCIFLLLLVMAIGFSGCTSPQPAPQAPVATPTVIPSEIPTTSTVLATPEKTAEVTKAATPKETEKVILTTKGTISPSEFKTYSFKDMGNEFSTLGDKYRVTLRADKPVIGYAVTRTQSEELKGSQLIPHYVSSSEKIQWGLIEPYMVLGRVTDATQVFTVDKVAPYVYVVDARWMESDDTYKTTPAFNYELTIAKVT